MTMSKAEIKRGLKLARRVQDNLNYQRFVEKIQPILFTLEVSDWIFDSENEVYVATIENNFVESVNWGGFYNYAEIFFTDDESEEIAIAAGIFSEGKTDVGKIELLTKNKPTGTINGEYYLFDEHSFVTKARKFPVVFVSDGSTTSSGGSTTSNKLDANFVVSPASVTLGSGETATLTCTKTSPAKVQAYLASEDYCKAEISGDSVILTGGLAGKDINTTCNFALLETQHYQPAFIDVPILIQKSEAYQVLMHFEDPENVLKNDGAINFTSATGTFNLTSEQKHFGDYSVYAKNGMDLKYK